MDIDDILRAGPHHTGNLKLTISQKLIEKMPFVRKEIDHIINNKVDSIETIENVLHRLLEYIPFKHGTPEFRKLNNYYKTIDPERSKDYAETFNQLINLYD